MPREQGPGQPWFVVVLLSVRVGPFRFHASVALTVPIAVSEEHTWRIECTSSRCGGERALIKEGHGVLRRVIIRHFVLAAVIDRDQPR